MELAWRPHHGTCNEIHHASDSEAKANMPLAYTQDREDYGSELCTLPDFGCVLFEPINIAAPRGQSPVPGGLIGSAGVQPGGTVFKNRP
jgi:hypothetical protein